MAKLDLEELTNDMVNAAKSVLHDKRWTDSLLEAETQFRELAKCIIRIEEKKLDGMISEDDSRDLIEMQKNAIKTVILQVEGTELVRCEMAINAALDVVRNTVNRTIGWPLL